MKTYLGTVRKLAGERFKKPTEKVPTEADALRPKRPPRFTIAGERGDDYRRCGSSGRKKSAGILGIVTLGSNGG